MTRRKRFKCKLCDAVRPAWLPGAKRPGGGGGLRGGRGDAVTPISTVQWHAVAQQTLSP
jgi:hypothetical protein